MKHLRLFTFIVFSAFFFSIVAVSPCTAGKDKPRINDLPQWFNLSTAESFIEFYQSYYPNTISFYDYGQVPGAPADCIDSSGVTQEYEQVISEFILEDDSPEDLPDFYLSVTLVMPETFIPNCNQVIHLEISASAHSYYTDPNLPRFLKSLSGREDVWTGYTDSEEQLALDYIERVLRTINGWRDEFPQSD